VRVRLWPGGSAKLPLASLAASVALALVACTPSAVSPADSPAPVVESSADAGGVAAADGLRPPADAGPLPASAEEGPANPTTWPASRLTGAGLAVSATPLLEPQGFGRQDSLDFEVYDVSAGNSPGAGDPVQEGTEQGGWQVPPLADGRQYAWRVAKAGTSDWQGPWTFDVDTVRPGLAPRDDFAGVSTHLMTGVPAVTWMSRSFTTVSSSAFANLEFQPGRAGDPGLPDGWRMTAPLVSRWTTLEASGAETPETVYISDARDRSMTFRRNDSGVYVQSWANGAPLPPGQQPTLTFDGNFELTERDGTVTTFSDGHPVAVSVTGLRRGTASWTDDGLLTSVTDPSDRTITFDYGGGSCPQWSGFVAAPADQLCRITWWDGSRTEIGYVPAGEVMQIGLIVDAVTEDFPGASLGLGWDASGRVSSLRSALVGAAAAADATLRERLDVLTQIAYDRQGRVAAVASPAPEPGGKRQVHVYAYPTVTAEESSSGSDVVASVASGEITGPLIAADDVTLIPSGIPGSADYRMTVRANDWTPVQRQDRDGAQIALAWNSSTGRLEGMRDYEGRAITFSYDSAGRRTGSQGPATSADEAYISTSTYDAQPDGTPMRGLKATYWASEDFAGDQSTGGWIDPGQESTLSHRWSEAPIPGESWSARLTGTWEVPEGGAWTFVPVVSADDAITVYVDNVLCDTSESIECTLDLKKGPRQLRIDISVADGGRASFQLEAAKGDGRPSPIDDVYPTFNAETRTVTNDVVQGMERPVVTTEYAEPWTGNPTSMTSPGNRTTTATYERASSADGQWGRKLTGTTPGGLTTATAYWPVTGGSEQSPCPDSSAAIQAGQVRTVTRTDGVPVETWYDAAGRPAAVRTGSGDAAELSCTTYAPDGTPVVMTQLSGGKVVESSTLQIAVGGDPRVSVTRVQVSGTLVSGEQTTRTTVDLLGRLVAYSDISGVTTTYAYDIFDRPTLRTMTSSEGTSLATVSTTYDDATGRVTAVAVDDEVAANVDYDAKGRVSEVTYGNGATQSWTYAPSGTVDGTRIDAKGKHAISDSVKANDAGRITNRTTELEGDGATKRSWSYAYDDARRLTDAVLKVDGSLAGIGRDKVSFGYTFDPQAECDGAYADPGIDLNRTGGERDGRAYATCYDGTGRPVSTSDPLLSGEGKAKLTWDDIGRLTAVSSAASEIAIAWQWGGLPYRIVDGPITSDLDHALGRLVAQRSADDSATVEWLMGYSSPSATAPAVILGDGSAEVRVLLPGGALWRKAAQTTIDHPGIRGEFIVRTDSAGAVVASQDGAFLAEALGPFGEPLGGGGGPGSPEYGYAFAQLQPTMPGPSGIVLKTARPYLPALGAFIAFDSQPGSSTTGYGYAEADPLNRSDPDGAYTWWDFGRDVLAVTSIAVSLALPGAQWYSVVAISLLTSSASLGVTALERSANGESLTGSDLVFEGISVATDVLLLGIGEAAGAVSRKLSKPAKAVGAALDDINVKPALQPANLEEPAKRPSWKSSVTKASLMVFGLRAITGGFSSGQAPAEQESAGVTDSNACPFEGGCAGIPDRGGAARSPM